MTPNAVRAALDAFNPDYIKDWDLWLTAGPTERPELFGQIMRRWQATRPQPMRRLRAEALHDPPYLEDLLSRVARPLNEIGELTLESLHSRTAGQHLSMGVLWRVFSELSVTKSASCVGISKAVLLLSDGRIGPALDSRVRASLGVPRPTSSGEWLQVLDAISADLAAFGDRHGSLKEVAPPAFRHLQAGRLYDMVFGPGAR